MRVALLENDRSHAELLSDWLAVAGHRCSRHAQGQTLVRALRHESFDVLILEGNLPDMSGVGVLKHVRRDLRSSVPVLFVTARDGESRYRDGAQSGRRRLHGQTSPPHGVARAARSHHSSLYSGASRREVIDLGSLRIDCQTRSAWLDDRPVHLTRQRLRSLRLVPPEHWTVALPRPDT